MSARVKKTQSMPSSSQASCVRNASQPSSSQAKGSSKHLSQEKGKSQSKLPQKNSTDVSSHTSQSRNDDDDEYLPSGSSQASKLSPAELEKMTNDTVAYILSQDYRKSMLRRQDIASHAMKNHGRCFNTVIAKAKEVFSEVYGLKLVEVERKHYFLVNKTLFPEGTLNLPEHIRAQQVLLLIILSYIFMLGKPVRESHLFEFLESIKIVTKKVNEVHPYFGDVRKLVTKDFVQMHYLTYQRFQDSNPPFAEFSFGERAIQEVPKRKLLEFVCKVNGDDKADLYFTQLAEVKEQEETLHSELADSAVRNNSA
ncbi:non-structural maintenance of chromosomes element 3 homolog [Anabrus simplex]|uniref:non-structural maintenance of chromosomes element 3 homolog n=1 Tax=Anabrus simplex TaxID=316456 RepID=UPI0035A2CB85